MVFSKYTALIAMSVLSSYAQTTHTWTGAAGDGLWGTAGNWDTGIVPSSSTDDVVFPVSGVPTSISISQVVSMSSYTINTPENYTFTLDDGSGKLEFRGGTFDSDVTLNNSAGSSDIVGRSPSVFNGDFTLNQGADIRGSDITWNGDIISSGHGISLNGARHIVNGSIDLDSDNTGGAGVFTLTSAGNNASNATQLNSTGNDWGTTRINFGGYLLLGADNAMPTDAGVQFGWHQDSSSSGTLDLGGHDQTVAYISQTSNFPDINGDQNITGGGTLTIDTVAGGAYEYHGRISDGATATSITKNGTGTQILENNTGTTSDYSGATTVNAGILQASSSDSLSASSAVTIASSATLSISGQDNEIGSLAGAGTVENVDNAGVLASALSAATLTTGADNTDTTFSGTIQDGSTAALSFTKTGTGTQTLTGANTYTGTTVVSEGMLSLSGAGSIDASEEIQILNGAVYNIATATDQTFANSVIGTGTIVGDFQLEASGEIAPGETASSIGTLNFDNNLVLDTDSVVTLSLSSALGNDPSALISNALDGAAGTNHDALNISGDLSGGGTFVVSLDYVAEAGDYFDLFQAGSVTGLTEGQLDLSSVTLAEGLSWDTSQFATTGLIMVIPEPTSSALFDELCSVRTRCSRAPRSS